MWSLADQGSFTVAPTFTVRLSRQELYFVLHLEYDKHEYLEERRLKDFVKKHSEFIGFNSVQIYQSKQDLGAS